MRRSLALLVLLAAVLVFALPGRAAGPGGWENVGGGLNDFVRALNTDKPGELLVGGRFTDAGGVAEADGIASWNGTKWSALGTGLTSGSDAVHAIAYKDGKIFAGGTFPGHLKLFNATTKQWEPTCGGDPGGPVDTLLIHDSTLYIGGSLLNAGGNPNADGLIKCDVNAPGVAIAANDGPEDLTGRVQALTFTNDDGFLYVGGQFINADLEPQADYIARYDGNKYKPVGMGKEVASSSIDTANVDALASDGKKTVYVGTDDEGIGGVEGADHIAKWDGFKWEAIGTSYAFGEQSRINAIQLVGDNVYATGFFSNVNGIAAADRIARFDGAKWTNVGAGDAAETDGPFLGEGYALAVFQGKLILGGGFVDAGGDTNADRLAAYPLESTTPTPTPTPTVGPVAKAATVTLTDTPKKRIKTSRNSVKVEFKFTAKNATKTVCKFDDGDYKTCESPVKRKVKRGKHDFAVAGVNSEGVRGKAATFEFRVVASPRGN